MAAAYAPPASGRREKIRFEYGQPQTLALKHTGGKSVAGAYGPQVLYTTTDERVFYLDLEDAQFIEQSMADMQIPAGQLFTLTKIRYPRGDGHSFQVRRLSPQGFSNLVNNLEQSIHMAQSGTRPRAPIAIADETRRSLPTAEGPQIATAADLSPEAELMFASFQPAIDAIAKAQEYAEKKGLRITFREEDVRAVAITHYINRCGVIRRAA
jgi:hypothetical protein